MEETITEIIKRLELKYLGEQGTGIKIPLNFTEIISEYEIPVELGIKFLILRNELEPRMKHCEQLQFRYAVHTGLLNSKDIYGQAYHKKFQETDIEKIERKMITSAQRYKKYGLGLTAKQLKKDFNYSIWWKMQHQPIIKEFGFFDPKVHTILTEYAIGREIQKLFKKYMYPYCLEYWLLREIKKGKKR